MPEPPAILEDTIKLSPDCTKNEVIDMLCQMLKMEEKDILCGKPKVRPGVRNEKHSEWTYTFQFKNEEIAKRAIELLNTEFDSMNGHFVLKATRLPSSVIRNVVEKKNVELIIKPN